MTRGVLAALGLAIALTVVMTWPLAARPGSVARYTTNDGRFSVWNIAWVAHAMTSSRDAVFDANIFHPHRGTLAYSEANLLAGALAVPAYVVTGNPVAAHNSAVFLALVFSFLSTWALVRRLTGSEAAGLVAATAFSFSTYVSAHTAHIQLLMVFVVPHAMFALHRFVEQQTWARTVLLGVAMTLAGLGCGYYGIFAALAGGLALVWFAPGQPLPARYWTRLTAAVLVGGLLIAPAMLPYVELRRSTGFKSAPNLGEAAMYSADAHSYLRSGAVAHQWLQQRAPDAVQTMLRDDREVLFPGIVITLLAIAGIASQLRTPRTMALYLTLTATAVWASFGPDAGLYTLLADWVPMMSFLRAPARVGVMALLGVAVLGGYGAAWLARRRRGSLLVAGLLVLTAVELKAVWPLVEVPPVPAVYHHLATLPRGGVVELHFPYRRNDEHQHARYMFWSMWHWQPLVNGYSDYIPPDFYEIATPINFFPDPESFRIMKARGVRYVLVHLDTYTEGPIRDAMLARFPPYEKYLTLHLEADNSRLYEIVAWPE